MVVALPTLAEVAADPAKIARLPGAVAAALGAAFAGLATSCALRAALERSEPVAAESLGTLSVDEAAALLGIQPSTLRHRAKHPPYLDLRVDNGTRKLRFSGAKIRAYLERPTLVQSRRGRLRGPA